MYIILFAAVPIWLEYVQYAIGMIGEPDGVKKIREVFERALVACSLHVTKGALVWEAYREFENAILAGLLVHNSTYLLSIVRQIVFSFCVTVTLHVNYTQHNFNWQPRFYPTFIFSFVCLDMNCLILIPFRSLNLNRLEWKLYSSFSLD